MSVLDDFRAAYAAADLHPVSHDDDTFQALCPVCPATLRVALEDDGQVVTDCPGGCAQSEIADALHFRTAPAEGFADGSGSVDPHPSHWLDGAPMDPAAEPPEPANAIPGFPFLIRGSAAVIVGPTGGGRSSLVQAAAYDAAAWGVRVAYLGHEVTEEEFNTRAADLAQRRGDPVTDELRASLGAVRYFDLATVVPRAWDDPAGWVTGMRDRFDVVIVDPLAAVASMLDLDFDKSNQEFSRFYDLFVQPLVKAGVSVVMLDNVGHAIEAKSRAKGASAKQDRPDLTFHCKTRAQPAGLLIITGKTRSVRVPFRRGDAWVFDRETQRIQRENTTTQETSTIWRPTVLMQRVSGAVAATPGISRTAIRNTVQGKAQTLGTALDLLIADGYVEVRNGGHFPVRPFPGPDEERQDPGSPHSSAVPGAFPEAGERERSPVPVPLNRGERGNVVPVPDLEAHLDDLASRHPEAA
jgi:hypothetical protein